MRPQWLMELRSPPVRSLPSMLLKFIQPVLAGWTSLSKPVFGDDSLSLDKCNEQTAFQVGEARSFKETIHTYRFAVAALWLAGRHYASRYDQSVFRALCKRIFLLIPMPHCFCMGRGESAAFGMQSNPAFTFQRSLSDCLSICLYLYCFPQFSLTPPHCPAPYVHRPSLHRIFVSLALPLANGE